MLYVVSHRGHWSVVTDVSEDRTASIRSLAAEEATLNMKASRSYETSVVIYQSTVRNISGDFSLQYCCENLKFRMYQLVGSSVVSTQEKQALYLKSYGIFPHLHFVGFIVVWINNNVGSRLSWLIHDRMHQRNERSPIHSCVQRV